MFVAVGPAGIPRLEDLYNFRAFKVVLPAGFADGKKTLQKIGRLDEAGYLWVDRNWLEQNGPHEDPSWHDGMQAMVAYAAKAGWVDAAGAIRAHIERL